MRIAHVTVGMLQENCYLLTCDQTGEGVVIDPGDEGPRIIAAVERAGMRLAAILLTHAHIDHVMAVPALKARYGVPLRMHEADLPVYREAPSWGKWLGLDCPPLPEPDGWLAEGERFAFGGVTLEVLHTPGHSPGSVTFVDRASRDIFCGDLLFAGSVGRTDIPGGSFKTLAASIRGKVFALGDDFTAHPGHGPATTVGRERRENPFVGERAKSFASSPPEEA
ncbi:MAG: MBL fold metallo-hydrolase [Planctomycetes bacterium]|nr:MBL fold metallo-hydrolase [Planctomycetota bacterium]